MGNRFDWLTLGAPGETVVRPGQPGSFPYDLLNLSRAKILRYGEREYGINLVWADPGGASNIGIVRSSTDVTPLQVGETCAVEVRRGGFLRYAEREYGINLVWSDDPVFEWRVELASGASGDVALGQPVALFNLTRGDYLFVDPRRYGIDLKWLSDEGKHNDRPWYEDAWNAATGVVSAVVNAVKEVLNRVLGLIDMVLTFFGIMLPKKLRLRVVILRDENGRALLGDENATEEVRADEKARLNAAIQFLKEVFADQVNTSIVDVDDRLIVTLDHAAPTAALDVGCDGEALGESLGAAGDYFRNKMAETWHGSLTGYGAPVTAFVVRDVDGKLGCSLGPLTDYVTVDLEGFEYDAPAPVDPFDDVGNAPEPPSTLAHEIGHACGLWHPADWPTKAAGNLMRPSTDDRGRILELHQRSVLRGSRHVTFL
ncbi:MAG: hypothetical protein ABR540_03025 [Acidimicrobiales bacterium]